MNKRTAMVVFSYYPSDPRVRREAEALQNSGIDVDIICLKNANQSNHEIINGVSVYRINLKRTRGRRIDYIFEYLVFFFYAFIKVATLHFKKRYDLVQVHNMPDFLVFTSLVPKFFGSKILLDLHDPSPEVYITKYGIGYKSIFIKLMIFIEQQSIKYSDFVITPNLSFLKLFVQRGCPSDKIDIIMNSPQKEIFDNDLYKNSDINHNFTLMYHGTIVERHGLDTALAAVNYLRKIIPNIKFKVYGEGDFLSSFLKMRKELGLEEIVEYYGHIPLENIAQAILEIDIGIIPNKLSCFTNINLPTRIFEYLCMGKSVVAPRTQGIMDYFRDGDLNFFNENDPESLSEVILKLYNNEDHKNFVYKNGLNVYKKYEWELQKKKYIQIVNNLLNEPSETETKQQN